MKKMILVVLFAILAMGLFANSNIRVHVSTSFINHPPLSGTVSAKFNATCWEYSNYQGDGGYTFSWWNILGSTHATGKAVINGKADSDTVPIQGITTHIYVHINDSTPINPPAHY